MYLAGLIADPLKMTKEDFEKWIENAYCYGLSDYTVATTLAKSSMAQEIADEWIFSNKDLHHSADWSCYCNLFKDKNMGDTSCKTPLATKYIIKAIEKNKIKPS